MSETTSGNAVLRTAIAPSEVLVDVTATLIIDLTGTFRGDAVAVIFNLGGASIFIGFSTSSASGPAGLATTNGVPIPSNATLTLDKCAGLAVWGIAAVKQTAGSGTRAIGATT